MSFQLPSVKVKPTDPVSFDIHESIVGGQDQMKYGLGSAKQSTDVLHPLAVSEAKYAENKTKMNLMLLQNTQGLHAPLRIAWELKFANKVGRLPFLPSSNIMRDVLTGNDTTLGVEDVFNTPDFWEYSGQPHAVVERSLGIL